MVSWLAFFTLLALVQTDHSPPQRSASLLVLPVPGKSISFEQLEERSRKLKGEASSVETVTRRVYRDSFGRLRGERAGSERSSAASGGVIQIIDPVAGSWVTLVSTESEKAAYCMPLPKSGGVRFTDFSLVADEGAVSRKWISRTEDLGAQKIEGLEFEGTRIVQAVEDEPWIIKTVEHWHSSHLSLIGLVVVSTPDETYTARIQNVRREEPDPALFKIPPGYRILNLPVTYQP